MRRTIEQPRLSRRYGARQQALFAAVHCSPVRDFCLLGSFKKKGWHRNSSASLLSEVVGPFRLSRLSSLRQCFLIRWLLQVRQKPQNSPHCGRLKYASAL